MNAYFGYTSYRLLIHMKEPPPTSYFFLFLAHFDCVRFLPIDYSVAASRKFFRRLYNRTSFLFVFFLFFYILGMNDECSTPPTAIAVVIHITFLLFLFSF